MKFVLVYEAKRKNAKRHVASIYGKVVFFDSVEDAKKHHMFSNPLYNAYVMSANRKETFAKNF
jgi:hypothetical protein